MFIISFFLLSFFFFLFSLFLSLFFSFLSFSLYFFLFSLSLFIFFFSLLLSFSFILFSFSCFFVSLSFVLFYLPFCACVHHISFLIRSHQGADFPTFANSDALSMHKDGSVTVSAPFPSAEDDEVLKFATSEFQLVSCLGSCNSLRKSFSSSASRHLEFNLGEKLIMT